MRSPTTVTTEQARLRGVLFAVGFAVFAALFAASVVLLVTRPAPIFAVDVAATAWCLAALAVVARRGPGPGPRR